MRVELIRLIILGLIIQKNYKFNNHIETLNDKLKKDLQVLKLLSSKKYGLKQDLMKNIIEALSVSKINIHQTPTPTLHIQ